MTDRNKEVIHASLRGSKGLVGFCTYKKSFLTGSDDDSRLVALSSQAAWLRCYVRLQLKSTTVQNLKSPFFFSMFGTKESLKLVLMKDKILFCKTIKEFKDKPEENLYTV